MQRRGRRRTSQANASSWRVPAAIAAATGLGIAALIVAGSFFGNGAGQLRPVELGATGHDVAVPTAGPDIHFAVRGVDFGDVPLGKEVGYTFSFANVGSELLRVEDVEVRVVQGC